MYFYKSSFDNMQKKKLGKSSVEVTPITFGAWAIGGWMWGGTEDKAAIRAIQASVDAGMTTIDTAPVYGFGKSEQLIGQALKGVPRESYQLLTKFGMNWQTEEGVYEGETKDNAENIIKLYKFAGEKQVIKECEASLRRLNVDYIDVLQIHWPDASTPINETMNAVAKLIEQGKVRAAGVCNYAVDQVEEAIKVLPIASNQVPYSMLRRDIESTVMPQALALGMSIIAYSPLQRGILAGKIKPNHVFNDGDTRKGNKYYTDENIQRVHSLLEGIQPIADGYGATLSQLVINWTTRQPAMDCVLVGARDEKQVLENVKALDFVLTDSELAYINQQVNAFQLA
jgi:aryl-alcohol dehydrogenase-like predicted oxidoreductase